MKLSNLACRMAALLGLAAIGHCAHADEHWVTDTGGCKIRSADPNPASIVIWSGPCINGFADGVGAAKWVLNGQRIFTYEGPMHAGKREGQGVLKTRTARYEGGFADNLLSGKGVLTWTGGQRYEGSFEQGKLSGSGIMYYANDEVFTGTWLAGVRTGRGSVSLPNGDSYEGNFDGGELQGSATYRWANGDRYEGQFFDGKPFGTGVYLFKNGNRYEGSFVNGLPSGDGVALTASGQRYEGTFSGGKPTGRGSYTASDDRVMPDPQRALSFNYATVAAVVGPVRVSSAVCTKMGEPAKPDVNWTGTAIYKAVAEVEDGRVTSAQIFRVQGPRKGRAEDAITSAILFALKDRYECPQAHVFEQVFEFHFPG